VEDLLKQASRAEVSLEGIFLKVTDQEAGMWNTIRAFEEE